jgi:hypothetical protein
MNPARRKLVSWSIRLCSVIGATFCFVEAARYANAGMLYVAETSSNPHPSETAKLLGPQLMQRASAFFFFAFICIALFVVSFFILRKNQNRADAPQDNQPFQTHLENKHQGE